MFDRQLVLLSLLLLLSVVGLAEVKVDPETLKSYAGSYKGRNPGGDETEFRFEFKEGDLFGYHVSESEKPWKMVALNQTTFHPIWASEKVTVTFLLRDGKVIAAKIDDDEEESNYRGCLTLKKVDEK